MINTFYDNYTFIYNFNILEMTSHLLTLKRNKKIEYITIQSNTYYNTIFLVACENDGPFMMVHSETQKQ